MQINRREFNRIVGAGIAAQALSPLAAMAAGRKVGYCIIGLGRISMGHFMPAVKQTQTSRITGLVSGHREKALRMAAQYGVPETAIYSYEEMDKIRDNPGIDAVYIALPNSMHAEYTIRSARAGKHVLCEKPMATSVSDARKMIDACRTANKKLMIEYRCLYEPTNLHAVKLIRDGKLGAIQAIESSNGYNIQPGEWRCDRKLSGGGPLMDVGIYSLNACRSLTGEEPAEIHACSSVIDHDGRFKDVEENVSWTMKFPSGIVACCNTTYGASMEGLFRVHGSKGTLEMEQAFGYQGQHLTAHLADAGKGSKGMKIDDLDPDHDPSQFVTVAAAFSKAVVENTPLRASGEEGLRDMECMDKIYRSCGLRMG